MDAVTGKTAANGGEPEEVLFDPRGLVELDETVPNVAEIDGDSAQFDAKDLTTRKINAELRRLVYEEGVKDVTSEAMPRGRRERLTRKSSTKALTVATPDGEKVKAIGAAGVTRGWVALPATVDSA